MVEGEEEIREVEIVEVKEDAGDRNQEAKAEVEGEEEECEMIAKVEGFFCCLVRNGQSELRFVK